MCSSDLSVDRIALDGTGKLIIAGSSIGMNTGLTTSTTRNGFVLSMNSATGAVSNVQTLATTQDGSTGQGVTIRELDRDSTGRVYLLGNFITDVKIGSTTLLAADTPQSSANMQGSFLAAFSPSSSKLAPLMASKIDPATAGLSGISSISLAITSDDIPVLGAVGTGGTDPTSGMPLSVGALAGINPTTGAVDWAGSVGGSAAAILVLVGVLSVLAYFFFSVEHKGAVGRVANVGVWYLMITFGASFGFTVMGRIALLGARFEFLFDDWLWLIDPTGKH